MALSVLLMGKDVVFHAFMCPRTARGIANGGTQMEGVHYPRDLSISCFTVQSHM